MSARSASADRVRLRTVVVQAAVPLVVGLVFLRKHHAAPATVLFSVAAALAALGLLAPAAFRRVERAGQRLGRLAGAALTWLALAPVFCLVFAPVGLLLRLTGRDPMRRRFRTDEPTYWVPHAPPGGAERYRRQF